MPWMLSAPMPDKDSTQKAHALVLYAGTYAFDSRVPSAISVFSFAGVMEGRSVPLQVLPMVNPSFFWQHPNQPFLYVVNETRGIPEFPQGTVTQCRISTDGRLCVVRAIPTGSAVPCHLSGTEKFLAIANYNGPSVFCVALDDGGTFCGEPFLVFHSGSGPNEKRQSSAHPHGAHFSPDGSFFAVPDLGSDEVVFYRPSGTALEQISAVACPPGSGPRHAAFHPYLARMYVLTELGNQLLVIEGGPEHPRICAVSSSLPTDISGVSHGAEILVHPSGKAVLASNRGHDSIAIWPMDEGGNLREVRHFPAGGSCPRSMAFDPSGKYLAVGLQGSDKVCVFRFCLEELSLVAMADVAVASPADVAWRG